MLIRLLHFLFSKLIGDLPEEKKRELWIKFNELITSATEGFAKGVTNK